MVSVTYPGVYIQEVPSGVRTITGVSTSTAMFIGRTERGVMDKPTRVFNYSEFSRAFGTSTAQSELATSVRLFFANGGTQAYIMRIANGATKASVQLENVAGAPVLTLTAREAGGRGGELRVAVDYNTPTPDSTFNLQVRRVDPVSLQESELEVHTDLTMKPGAARYAIDVVNQDSALVTATPTVAAPSEGSYNIAGLVLPVGTAAALDSVIPDGSILRREINGQPVADVTINDGALAAALADCDLEFAAAGTGKWVLRINKETGDVRFLPSGAPKDVATILQLGPTQGGAEVLMHSSLRPAPSGVFSDGYLNIAKIAALQQGVYDDFKVTAAGKGLTGFNLKTTADNDLFHVGKASKVSSLLNVREKLNLLASQFNAKAQALSDFRWQLEVQGLLLVLRPTLGAADVGLGVTIDDDDTDLFDVDDGFVSSVGQTRYYTVGLGGASAFEQGGAAGSDGSFPQAAQYLAAYDIIARDVDVFNLLVLPRDAGIDDDARKDLWGPASIFCQQRRAFLLVDPPKTWNSTAAVTGAEISVLTLRQGLVKDHSGVYWPRLLVPNEHGLVKPVDPSGAIAGLMARIDSSRGVHKAPAGIEADIRGISGVERMISDPENGVTNALAVNTIRVFPNGIVSWGARTMDGFDNSGNSDYQYVPIRRLALFLAESLQRGLKFAVFEPNDEPLWAQIRLAAGSFMNGLFRQGSFQGQKKSDAYFVKVDAETTTQNDINLGIVNVIVGFAPLKPAEFVIVKIQQIAGQIQT